VPFNLNQTGDACDPQVSLDGTEANTAENTSYRSRIVSCCLLVNRQLSGRQRALISSVVLDSQELNGWLKRFLKFDTANLSSGEPGTAQSPPCSREDRSKQQCGCCGFDHEAH